MLLIHSLSRFPCRSRSRGTRMCHPARLPMRAAESRAGPGTVSYGRALSRARPETSAEPAAAARTFGAGAAAGSPAQMSGSANDRAAAFCAHAPITPQRLISGQFPAAGAAPANYPPPHTSVVSPLLLRYPAVPLRRTSDRLSEVRRRGNGGVTEGQGRGWLPGAMGEVGNCPEMRQCGAHCVRAGGLRRARSDAPNLEGLWSVQSEYGILGVSVEFGGHDR